MAAGLPLGRSGRSRRPHLRPRHRGRAGSLVAVPAAVGPGGLRRAIEVQVDVLTGASELGQLAASFTVTVPIAVFVLSIWWIALRQHADRVVNVAVPVAAVLVLLDPLIPVPVTLTAVIMTLLVVVLVLRPPLSEENTRNPATAAQAPQR